MKVRYDQEIDVLYIRFKDESIVESDEVSSGIIIDFAKDGTPVGVEILDARKRKGILPYKVELELLQGNKEKDVVG